MSEDTESIFGLPVIPSDDLPKGDIILDDLSAYLMPIVKLRVDAPLAERVKKGSLGPFEALCIQAFLDAGAQLKRQPLELVFKYGQNLGEVIEFYE